MQRSRQQLLALKQLLLQVIHALHTLRLQLLLLLLLLVVMVLLLLHAQARRVHGAQ